MIKLLAVLTFLTALPFGATAEVAVSIGYLKVAVARTASLSNIDLTPRDAGLSGARLGLKDNLTTGKFLGHSYTLTETLVPVGADAILAARALLPDVEALLVDAPANTLLALSLIHI